MLEDEAAISSSFFSTLEALNALASGKKELSIDDFETFAVVINLTIPSPKRGDEEIGFSSKVKSP